MLPRSARPSGFTKLFVAALATVFFTAFSVPVAAQTLATLPDDFLSGQDFRHVGPVGNRVSAVIGEPGNANVYYIGAASGGVWKSVDGGVSWQPIFDDQPAQSIGALALAPSDPNVLWAGTGEPFIRSNVSIGNGVYRSTDGGDTWGHMGLDSIGRVGRIVIDPRDPNVVFVAALGTLYGPQQQRGVYRTKDGGETWERVLFSDANTGAVDIVMNPTNPRILYAAMWTMQIWTWGRESGGQGDGLWKSTDSGDTWTRLEGHGLPTGTMGKIGLAVSRAAPHRVYALIETNSNDAYQQLDQHEGVLWRSDDDGATWNLMSKDHTLAQRPLYYSRMAVEPDDADEVHFMSTRHSKTLDGGLTIESGGAGGDNHDVWIDPKLPDRIIVGHDGGISISTTRGKSWFRPQIPMAQMYHVFTDNAVPYNLYGNRQDGSSFGGPSNTLTRGGIPLGAWHTVGGCESGFAIPDTVTNDVVWSGCYEGVLDRSELSTGITRTVSVWPDNPEGWPAAPLRYRFQWTFPIAISPHDHNTVYAGSQHVHRTTNGGQSWEVISPDLTTNDKSRQQASGGLTTDDVSPTYYSVLFAIAESPVEAGVIWAGSNDGLVHVTRDDGGTWEDVTKNIPRLPPSGTVSNIEPSRFAAGKAYITVDFHQLGNTNPYVYVTENYGKSWRSLASGIPKSVFSYAHVVREDPTRAGMLYLGTENSVYVTWDDGATWHALQGDLPHAPAYWMTVQAHFDDLAVSTYGRGFWILDDVTPLQQLTDAVLASPVHLFTPRNAYRFVMREGTASQPGDPAAGDNPDYGATLNFYLKDDPTGPVSVTIEDEAGHAVRRLETDGQAGLNRVVWDLTYTASARPRLRTAALEHDHVSPDPEGWRSQVDGGAVRPLAVPGRYRVQLKSGDEERTAWLTVLQDPDSKATAEDMQAKLDMQLELRDMTDSTAALINRVEWTRKGLYDLVDRLSSQSAATDVVASGEALQQALVDLEMHLYDLRLSGGTAGQDTVRWPRQLLAKLTSLSGYISGSDDRPTDQATEVRDLYREQLTQWLARWGELASGDIARLNRMLADRGLPPIVS